MTEKPLYIIGVVAEELGVRESTLREWERQDLVRPARRNGIRFYSANDLQRLRFVKGLIDRGLNAAGVAYLVKLYPCWFLEECPRCTRKTERKECARVCWKEEGTYCLTALDEPGLCETCEYNPRRKDHSTSDQAACEVLS